MTLTDLARPKVNLFLHVTGKRIDGYHLLESLAVFVEGGDRLTVQEGDALSLFETGPFAADTGCNSANLVMKAADLLRKECGISKGARLLLEKNLPVASGIGGGSADAAAALRLLNKHWSLNLPESDLADFGLRLGADVPVCIASQSTLMRGIGEKLETVRPLPDLAILLVNPGISVSTPSIFKALRIEEETPSLQQFETARDQKAFIQALKNLRNDLEPPAIKLVPEISDLLDILKRCEKALLSRMSGSGATCFALFNSLKDAKEAEESVSALKPDWWTFASTFRA
ncbi:MAG: 4-(cytidine 5'-diphospho)-2-C-methyl-D-erythritol kinase [Sneathiellales bacterium]|nr:4-(cytidine 5'-diphospho)-2-C-methyl-D-erythritol kinase [Sneathiellales bacterium]